MSVCQKVAHKFAAAQTEGREALSVFRTAQHQISHDFVGIKRHLVGATRNLGQSFAGKPLHTDCPTIGQGGPHDIGKADGAVFRWTTAHLQMVAIIGREKVFRLEEGTLATAFWLREQRHDIVGETETPSDASKLARKRNIETGKT